MVKQILNICRFLIKHERRHNWMHRSYQISLVHHRYGWDDARELMLSDMYNV